MCLMPQTTVGQARLPAFGKGHTVNRSTANKRTSVHNQLPKKWILILLGLALVYALAQPLVNRQFGWQLPSLQSLLSKDRVPAPPDNRTPADDAKSIERAAGKPTQQPREQIAGDTRAKPTNPEDSKTAGTADQPRSEAQARSEAKADKPANANAPSPTNETDATAPLYGVLRDAGREVYVSPAGLRYTRGSEEGHRLKHLERHLNDQPDRPGKHGVFTGNMPQVLRWIDEGYTRARQNEPGTQQRQEQGRTVYEADFPQAIGYVGGRDGNRRGRPATQQLRIVTEEDRVITAFPF